MEKIPVKIRERKSLIIVGECFNNLIKYFEGRQTYIITDRNLENIYKERFPDCPVYVVSPGEKSKDLSVVSDICRWLLDQGADRGALIVGIGGGVVCDLTGFVAATYMRGVRFGFVATSLLAMVDAAIGGKNGVNLDGYKNIIGTFTQPEFVICDVDMLLSLPESEFINGMTEVIKHSLINDSKQFGRLEQFSVPVMARERNEMEFMVGHSARIKATIVEMDELEHGERKKLNLGHTWGHAIETVTGMPHGQAVAIGLVFSAGLSVKYGLMTDQERNRLIELLKSYDLPVESNTDPATVLDVLVKDKKKDRGAIHFVLMKGIGDAVVKPIEIEELRNWVINGK